jgi:hypothetical protein
VRHTITVADSVAAAAMLANSLGADVLELEVPATTLHSSLCAFGPLLLPSCLLVGDGNLLVFHLGKALQTFRFGDLLYVPTLELDELWVRNTLFSREEGGRESLCCIITCELTRLGGRVEQLLTRGRVNGEVINALMRRERPGLEWCRGKHGQDGIIVRFSQSGALDNLLAR